MTIACAVGYSCGNVRLLRHIFMAGGGNLRLMPNKQQGLFTFAYTVLGLYGMVDVALVLDSPRYLCPGMR